MSNTENVVTSFQDRLKQKQQKIPQTSSNKIIVNTNSLTDAIFDISASFYGDERLTSSTIYSYALSTYYKLLDNNFFSILKPQITIEKHLEDMFFESNSELDSRKYHVVNEDLDELLGIEHQFRTIVEDEYCSKRYKITQIPTYQLLFDNACNNYTNCFLKHLIGQSSEIAFPTIKDFLENQNLDWQSRLLLTNREKLLIKPSIYDRKNGAIHTEPDLDISQKEYESQLKALNIFE